MKRIHHRKPSTGMFLAWLLVTLVSCTDDAGEDTVANKSIYPKSTGWEKVSTIPYRASRTGIPGWEAMTPRDLAWTGSELVLLYSEDFKLSGYNGETFYKVKLENGTTDVSKAEEINYARYPNAVPVYRFIPGSFTTISMQYYQTDCFIMQAGTGMIGAQSFGTTYPIRSAQLYPGGTLLLGIKDNENISALWHYQYPNTSNFTSLFYEWKADSTAWKETFPMKLTDNRFYNFILSAKNNKAYFSVVKLKEGVFTYPNANFDITCRNLVPGLNGNSWYTLLASDVSAGIATFLLGEFAYKPNGGDVYMKQVHAYRWKEGTTTLEKLYGDVSIPEAVGRMLLDAGRSISQPNEIRFTPAGTAYVLYEGDDILNGTLTRVKYLLTFNGEGVQEHGRITEQTAGSEIFGQFKLSTCRYIQGNFYALVHPVDAAYTRIDDPMFRMELVKLTQ